MKNRLYRQIILKEEIQIAKKYLRKCSISLATMEIQIKPTQRFCTTPIRMAKNNKSNKISC